MITIVTAISLLLAFATPRTLLAVRLWGGPTIEGPQSLRIQCVRRAVGVEDGVSIENLSLKINDVKIDSFCDPRGYGEVRISPNYSGRFSLHVSQGENVFAEGEVQVTEAEWRAGAILLPAKVASSGTLPISAYIVGGSLLLERTGEIVLALPEELRARGQIDLSTDGLTLLSVSPHPMGLSLQVRPTFFTAMLLIKGREGGAWEAKLPVRMSGLAADGISIEKDVLRTNLRTPTAARFAYLQLQDERGRLAATSIPLVPDGHGGAYAPLEITLPPRHGASWLLTSTWPQPSEDGTIPWPLDPAGSMDGRIVPDRLWVDGVKPAVQRESARLQRRLWLIGWVVLLGAITEALLLYERAHEAKLTFQRHLIALGEEAQEAQLSDSRSGLRVLLAISIILFGFAILGAILMAQIG